MSDTEPLIVVAGGDTLVENVCRDLREAGHRVTVVWEPVADLRERIERCGGRFVAGSPRNRDVLVDAGVDAAAAFMALDQSDQLNIEAAMQARELNSGMRIVLRQFNRALAHKIEQNLVNCSVVSLAALSAATYAAAAVERDSFLGVEFPRGSRSIVAFARRTAQTADVAGLDVAHAEQRLGCRILSRSGEGSDALDGDEELVLCAPLPVFAALPPALHTTHNAMEWIVERTRAIVSEFDPLLRVVLIVGIGVFAAATGFFGLMLHLNPVTAAYFVTQTMTTVGYGDIALADKGSGLQLVDILLMGAGIVLANLALAFVAAALIRAQWNAVQGLRPIRDAGHIVVFGAGRVGTRVVDYLCELGALITVVELDPTPELLRRARFRQISLLTGDGTQDETLDLCNIEKARSTVAVTDKDATNLEVGFGARARRGDIPVIVRVAEPSFATAIRKHFEIRRAFSAAALASGVFADLVGSARARGRISFGDRSYSIAEYDSANKVPEHGTIVATSGDAVLVLTPRLKRS
jgi:Trk K+ transport system NAD-binding subunit